jgi:hypothetical protein
LELQQQHERTVMKLFSAFAAAELLERDRQTIIRALRNTPPDGRDGPHARWKMSTIISAMERHSRASGSGFGDGSNRPETAQFAQACEAMKMLPTLAQRRAAAIETIPLLVDAIKATRAQGLDMGDNPETSAVRGELLCQTSLDGLAVACEWRNGEAWQHFNAADVD